MKKIATAVLLANCLCVVCLTRQAVAQVRQPVGAATMDTAEHWDSRLTPEDIVRLKANHARASELEKTGTKLLLDKKYEDAAGALKESLSLRDGNTTAYRGLIEAYTMLGQMQEAIATNRRFIYPAPDKHWSASGETDPVDLSKFALLLNKAGEWKEAVSVYQQALRFVDGNGPLSVQPNNLDVPVAQKFNLGIPEPARFEIAARNALAVGYYKKSKEQEAVAEWENVLKLQPKNPYAHYYLARFKPVRSQADADTVARHFTQAQQYGDKKMRARLTPDSWSQSHWRKKRFAKRKRQRPRSCSRNVTQKKAPML